MPKKDPGPEFESSAGLVRRHDVDERKNLQIHPGWVIAAPFIIAALIALVVIVIGLLSS